MVNSGSENEFIKVIFPVNMRIKVMTVIDIAPRNSPKPKSFNGPLKPISFKVPLLKYRQNNKMIKIDPTVPPPCTSNVIQGYLSNVSRFISPAPSINPNMIRPGVIKIDWAKNIITNVTKISHPDLTCPALFFNNDLTYFSGYSNIISPVSDSPCIVAVLRFLLSDKAYQKPSSPLTLITSAKDSWPSVVIIFTSFMSSSTTFPYSKSV